MAQEPTQIFSNIKKNILARWITRLIITKYSASPKLVLQIIKEIHRERVFLAPQATVELLGLRPIGHNWFIYFK